MTKILCCDIVTIKEGIKYGFKTTDDESKIKTAYEKCVVELPKWTYGGIPVDVLQQDNALYTIEVLEDEEETKGGVFNDEDIQTHD